MTFAALITGALLAQTTDSTPQFGIADVHARPPDWIPSMRSGFAGGIYQLRNATMVDLIRTAWSVDADKVVGGPEWLDIDRFDVVATAPPGSTPGTLRTMLRGLLKDRFQLVARNDTGDFPAYALTVGKKLQLTQSEVSGNAPDESGCRFQPGAKPPTQRSTPGEPVAFACRNITMAALASALPTMRGTSGYLFNYGVVDRTGLKGTWDFSVKWSIRAPGIPSPTITDTTTIFDAFERQLGLKLELVKIPMPVVVVDSVTQKPTGNLPGVTEKLPLPLMQFEVAEIKPIQPDDPQGSNVRIDRGGMVRIYMTLKGLIQEAWGDMNGDLILGGPKSLDATRFAIIAKAPVTDLASDGAAWNGIDIDSMRKMLRALVIDRFRLVTHTEDRLVPGYALVASKPKLRKADPANRPGCKEGPGPDGKDPRTANPMAARLVTCRNMTLAQFAIALTDVGGGYLRPTPAVADLTGIEGRYDMTISFTPFNAFRSIGGAPPPGADAGASDPNGVISIFEAVDRQLGLKLELRKVTAQVLIIDHVNEIPTEN